MCAGDRADERREFSGTCNGKETARRDLLIPVKLACFGVGTRFSGGLARR